MKSVCKINADAMTLNDPGAKKEPDSCNLFVFQGGIFQNALKKVEMRNDAEFPGGKPSGKRQRGRDNVSQPPGCPVGGTSQYDI
jgi:hypothetical protein